MGQIDVTELLCDPDFVSPITLIHRKTQVNALGENVLTESGVATIGCIQPMSGKTLQRLPEALRVGDNQTFYIKGNVTADRSSKYPDIIVFRGQRYVIQMVFDWTNWGQGWVEGTCVRERPAL